MLGACVQVLLCLVVAGFVVTVYHFAVQTERVLVVSRAARDHGDDAAALHEQLTREYEASDSREEEVMEGHSASCGHKPELHRALVRQRASQSRVQVCETGFNLGHSAITWLSAAPNVHLLSFDLGEHRYSAFGARFVRRVFGNDRFSIVFGDSLKTVPAHFARHPELKCDVFMVDGGHAYEVAMGDLLNAVRHIVPHGLLLIDDTHCAAEFCVDAPWKDFVAKNQHRLVSAAHIEYEGPPDCNFGSGVSGAFVK